MTTSHGDGIYIIQIQVMGKESIVGMGSTMGTGSTMGMESTI